MPERNWPQHWKPLTNSWPSLQHHLTNPSRDPLRHDHVARGLTLSPAVGPEVEHVVQIDIGWERRDHRALPCPPLTDGHDPVFHDDRLEPFADQADDTPVADPMLSRANP